MRRLKKVILEVENGCVFVLFEAGKGVGWKRLMGVGWVKGVGWCVW